MSIAAIRYAKAIIDTATDSGKATQVNEDMRTILAAMQESQELTEFLSSPITANDLKISALTEVFAKVQLETKSLFRLLQENKRFEILGAIAQQYIQLFDERNGVEVARVTTAIPMDAQLEQKVLAKVATITTKKVTLENIVNPEIIGGFILRIGDKQYNASVAHRLQELKREFSN